VQTACCPLGAQRLAYVHVAGGEIHINNTLLTAGDAALFRQQSDIQISGGKRAEVLLFDLPADG
jgi:redox-sensitive bicupin YhaK (pirin superfamily)